MDNNTLLPQAFIDKMKNILPSHLQLNDLIEYCHKPLRRAVRVNTLKISIEDFQARAKEHQWQLTPIPWCKEGFWIDAQDDTYSLGNSAEHQSGLCYIQEASSMMPVAALFHFFKQTDNAILLDAAAAPGSKTTQMAAQMQNQGLIIANEYSSSRIKMLHANIQRCGIKNVALTHFDAAVFGDWLPETFDAILLDAPCSGEGTVRKDKYAMKNWSQAAIYDISNMQSGLIESAFNALKPSGILIYSTCTLSHEENHNILSELTVKYPNSVTFLSLENLFEDASKALTKEGFLHIWPQIYDSEGFFVAALQKTQSTASPNTKKRPAKLPFSKANSQEQQDLFNYFNTQFSISNIEGSLYKRDQEFWLFPTEIEPIMDKIRFSRLGIKIAEQFGKGRKTGFKTMHEFARTFGDQSKSNKIEISAEQANDFYQGKDIREVETNNATGEVLVSYRDNVIGIGKVVSNRIKNNLPRDLIHDKKLFEK